MTLTGSDTMRPPAIGGVDTLYDTLVSGAETLILSPAPGDLEEGSDMAGAAALSLPGEDAPLAPRRGGLPPTGLEALRTARRMAREYAKRSGKPVDIPEVLPFAEESGTTPLLSVRVPRRKLWFAHAKADMEERDLSAAVREFVEAYGSTPPGWVLTFVPPTVAEDEA